MDRISTNEGAEQRLRSLGIQLPEVRPPVANYVPFVHIDNLLFLSGHGPVLADGSYVTGKVGSDLSIDQGYAAARLVGLQLLAVIRRAVGSLDRVHQVVKLLGMVNSPSDFVDHPRIINGCSDLMVEVFGERGRHARSAVGMGSLPGKIAVEIEAIIALVPN